MSEPLLAKNLDLRKARRSTMFVIRDKHQKTEYQKISDYWVNEGAKLIFMTTFVIVNLAAFTYKFLCSILWKNNFLNS